MSNIELGLDHEWFQTQLDTFLKTHAGQFALVKNQKVIGFYTSHEDAFSAGIQKYGLDDIFYVANVERNSPQPISYAWNEGVMFG